MAKVVLVEDERFLNDAYKLILESEKHTVYCAYNGQEGIDLIKKHTPDLVLLDLIMPEMTGIEVLEKLKPKKSFPNMKIVVFTNIDSPKDIDKVYELGADKYMLKVWASPTRLNQIVCDTLAQ